MTDKQETTLKPCPFCGSKEIEYEDDRPQYHWHCESCKVYVSCADENLWNKRIVEENLAIELEAALYAER